MGSLWAHTGTIVCIVLTYWPAKRGVVKTPSNPPLYAPYPYLYGDCSLLTF